MLSTWRRMSACVADCRSKRPNQRTNAALSEFDGQN